MRRIILSSVRVWLYYIFSTFSHKRYDFREKQFLNIKCVFWSLYNFCLKHFSLQREFGEILYSRAPVPTDSVSAANRGPKKNWKNFGNKRFTSFKTYAKRERVVTWWNPAAQTRSVLDSSSFVPVPTLKRQNPLLSYIRERQKVHCKCTM
jgi:hypothetical protein